MSNNQNNSYNDLLPDLLLQGSVVRIAVWGLSMFPFLHSGDVVLVKPLEEKDLKFGQLVVFRSGPNWVVHRFVGQNHAKGLVYTRGDGLAWRDKSRQRVDLVGVVTAVEQSRWKLARSAIGRWAPVWAAMAPVTGPLFRLVVRGHGVARRLQHLAGKVLSLKL